MALLFAEKVTIVNPTAGPPVGKPRLASRPATLDGLVVGAIWNSRPYGDKIIRAVISMLQERYKLKDVVFLRKPWLGNAAPPEIYDPILAPCDLSITRLRDL